MKSAFLPILMWALSITTPAIAADGAGLDADATVLLRVEVLPDGRPGTVRIQQSSGHDVLDKDALRQLTTWRFIPPQSLGRPHPTWVIVPVKYRLNSKGRP